MNDYGSATVTRHDDGRVTVEQADPVIGITFELLGQSDPELLRVDGEGLLWLGGDQRYRYRPVRFVAHPDVPGEGARILVCERVG